ncbi:thiopeptide-type bacteriocin biosynthesis protein [Flavobacterium collinsii]|uniref:thiopeptide-type bacteriocin biosynthesis protein n=1 Tax=Flavobacterium collinsii TaxID=1114861 RepID=UPI00248F7A1F|nr:thiopeptide-type bacteriocin biosynthesis protein [Flavobacterium collinsii]
MKNLTTKMPKKSNIQRNFIVGDEWLYYKIYTGFKTSDLILTEIFKPLTKELIKSQKIKKWFFIRYSDPDNHLRIRFQFSKEQEYFEVINKLNPLLKKYLNKDLIWKIQIDTYQREIERYGEKTIEPSEGLFFHDSVMISEFLDLIEGEEGEEIRWLFCLKAIDQFLNDFEYNNKQKLNLLENLKNNFAAEFRMDKHLKIQVDTKYRLKRKTIETFMNCFTIGENQYIEIENLLKIKSISISTIVAEILNYQNLNLDDFLNSHIHMLTNRLFKSNGRSNEMVVYDFLYRHYNSLEAKNKKQIH